jgi:hypothetical protein
VILGKAELRKMRKLKLQGKGDQAILFEIMRTAKFDIRESKDFDEAQYPKIDLGKIMKEIKDDDLEND